MLFIRPVLHVIPASLPLGFPGEQQSWKATSCLSPAGHCPCTLQGRLLHPAQLLHPKLELMPMSLILFQSCLLCQNMEPLSGTEKTLPRSLPGSQQGEVEGSIARVFAAWRVEGKGEGWVSYNAVSSKIGCPKGFYMLLWKALKAGGLVGNVDW